jgi:predicted GNAT family N-acyltransferase
MQRNIRLIRLTSEYQIKKFDCGDSDLNDFLINDSKKYLQELLAVTYLIESNDETVAFFSLFNDKISIIDTDSKSQWHKLFRNKMPQGKRLSSYPAMKIGRLAVSGNHKGQGWGTTIIDYLKELFISNNRTGCRYFTVDAYKESLGFYEKNGFIFLTAKDASSDTRLMYFDLMHLKKS